MSDNNHASEKKAWERMIKQNMVPLRVDGSHSTYVLDDCRVLIGSGSEGPPFLQETLSIDPDS